MGGTKNAYFIFSSRSIGAGAAVVGTALVIFQIQQIILDHLFSNLDGRSLVVFGKPGDGSHLQKINTNAGVAINPYGSEVAFLGLGSTGSAVFGGQAPLPPAP